MTATDIPPPKDWRPKIRGSARAYADIVRLTRIDQDGYTPFVHQADGLAKMRADFERFDSFGLLHDMGCGKTLTMLAGLLALHEMGAASTMFVACPKSVVSAWGKECAGLQRRGVDIEFLAMTQTGSGRRATALRKVLEDRAARAAAGEALGPLVVSMNYESTHRLEADLRAANFDVVVCDESQKIKAPGSKQSLAMFRIGKPCRYRVIMTGTPVPEGGLDWYGQMRFLDWTVLGKNYGNFKAKYALEIDCGTFRKVVVNPHRKHELEGIVMERCHRVSKAEAVDLPPALPALIEFELEPKQRKIYDDLVKDSLAYIERAAGEPGEVVADMVLTRILRLQQITGGYVQVSDEGEVRPCIVDAKGRITNPKLTVLEELMEALRDAGKKLVIFHRFTHEGLAIEQLAARMLGKNGPPVSVINGRITGADRGRMVDQFQEGDTPFFVGQIQACAEGITLHAASDLAHYSMPHAAAIYQQANARVDRIGQKNPVTNHHLIALRTIDESLYASQERKKDASDDAVDGGWKRYLEGDR